MILKKNIHKNLGDMLSDTYDLERLMTGATLLKCSEFGDALIDNM